MIQLTAQTRIFVAIAPADFRRGIDGLAKLTREELDCDPFCGALFVFRNRRGARTGDLYMSLIHTAELGRVNTFEYLVALQRNAEAVAREPGDWMPWNFLDTIEAGSAANLIKK